MYQGFKFMMDRVFSAIALLLLGPLMALLALAIRLDSAGPAFFRQKRAGRNGRFFTIYKFRTMRKETPHDMPTHMLTGANRHITRLGQFMRKSSLDELPQLLNILRGDMSLVGPRPALWNQDDLIALRKSNGSDRIRPGLTGWAQVNGRDELPISRKAELDGEYAANLTLGRDLRILVRTALQVFHAEGVVEGVQKP